MHYYQFNIGDYRRDAGYLTPMQHYIYRSLIDWYFLDEKPIPSDIETVTRKLSLSNDRSTDVQQVFNDFFTLDSGRYIHARIEADIDAYHRQISDASKAGKASAAARKANKQAALERALNDRATDAQPTRNYKQETINQEPSTESNPLVASDAGRPDCPHQEIIRLYHEKLPELAGVKVWNKKRMALLQARWREDESRQSLEFWGKFFNYVSKSNWLMGRTNEWQCNLEWLLNSSNFVKVLEGNYELI